MNRTQVQKWGAAMSLSILLFSVAAFGQNQLVRGPYLNIGTPESMVVRWRTSTSETGGVAYGTSTSNLADTVWESSATTEHEVDIVGLSSNTKYFYTVLGGGQNLSPIDDSYYFQTSPTHGTVQPIRVWAIGDFGNGSQAQYDVKTGYTENFGDVHTDVWLWLGDNAYGDGTDQEYQEKVFEVYPEVLRNTVTWPCPGNHDYGSVDLFNNGPYFDIMTLPTNGEAGGVASGEESYFSFDYGNAHFISINSEYLPWILTNNSALQTWLEQDLQSTTADWIIAFWHQPPYSKGTHDSDESFSRMQFMRQNVAPLLEEYGVDLVLNGHSHSYERSYLIHGHYGTSDTWNPSTMLIDGTNGNPNDGNGYQKYYDGNDPNLGAVYAVVGCSGQKGSGNSDLNHPVMYMSTEDYHGSMVIDIDGMELNAKFIDTTGAVLDEFVILKSESPSGINQYDENDRAQMNVFPNPFKEDFTIEFTLKKSEEVELRIMDVKGNVIQRFAKRQYPAGCNEIKYSPQSIPSNGIYIVEMQTASNLSVKRLVRTE
jgi:hypothetical protein